MERDRWENFKHHLCPYAFVVYSLVLTIVSFIIELSPTFRSADYWFPYSVFGCCNLLIPIIFYVIVGVTSRVKFSFFQTPQTEVIGVGASVFFVKLGATFFSIAAIVLWSTELFLAFAANMRPWICILRTCFYIVFHVVQLFFVLKSDWIVFCCHRILVYFGLAHTISVNLWVWISLCIAKSEMQYDRNETYHVDFYEGSSFVLHPTDPPTVVNIIFERHEYMLRTVKYFGNNAIILLTGNVEFCLISAGICLNLYYSTAWSSSPHNHRKADFIRFDYRNTGISIALGLAMFILFCLSFIFGGILRDSGYFTAHSATAGIFQCSFYTISIVTCVIVYQCLFKHRSLNPEFTIAEGRDALPHEKNINVIFLLLGAGGDILYCYMALLGVARGDELTDWKELVITVFLVRAIEVVVQAVLLYYLLKEGSTIHPCDTVGKQAITFLIALNLILFGFHTLESSVSSFGFSNNIDSSDKIFIKISYPLVVFFRFHCSVCFAEIWKIFFQEDTPLGESTNSSISNATSNPRLSVDTSTSEHQGTSSPPSAEAFILPDPPESVQYYRNFSEVLIM